MREDDRACSLILLGIALAACLGAFQYEVGTFNNPGPGLFPLVLGAVLGVLSLMILAGGVMAKRAAVQGGQATGGRSIYSKEALYVVLALIGFGFLLVPLGFIVTTFAVFAALLRFVTKQKWPVVVGGALVLSLGAFVVFDVLLGVPLPRGALGI